MTACPNTFHGTFMASFWSKVKSLFGFEPVKVQEQRLPMPQADRWTRLLKALQVSRGALIPALERELQKGMQHHEKMIEPSKEQLFFDGLVVGKLTAVLEMLCVELDPDAVTDRIMSKIPSLRDWAVGALTGEPLTRASNPDVLAWARDAGRLKKGVLREALLAEAIECGRSELAKRELSDAGMDHLDSAQMQTFMGAFAQRKESGLSDGLDAAGLDAFAAAMGGWEAAGEAAAGLGRDELLRLIDDLLDAIKDEELIETKLFEKAKEHSTKKVREIIAKAVAVQAAKNNHPIALKAAIKAGSDVSGVSPEKVARIKHEQAPIKVGSIDVKSGLSEGLTLFEIAKLSNAKGSQQILEQIDKSSAKISSSRMNELITDTEKSVRTVVMRSSGEQRESTKAWRETVKEWKQGLLEGVDLKQMQSIVNQKTDKAEAHTTQHSTNKPKI